LFVTVPNAPGSSLPKKPEQHAREQIDAALAAASWVVQDAASAGWGLAFPATTRARTWRFRCESA